MPYPGLHMRQVIAYHSIGVEPVSEEVKEETSRIQVQSLSDDDPNNNLFPLCDGCKRAYMNLDIHVISSASDLLVEEDGSIKTQIFMQQRMNPHVSKLPLFMVNAMNQRWGIAALHKLVRLSHRALGWDNLYSKYSWKDLKQSLSTLFPLEG